MNQPSADQPSADRQLLQAEAKELLDEARWLHAYHLQRGESAQQRAVAIIGFAGVLITLVPIASAKVTGWQAGVLVAGLGMIVASALAGAVVMAPSRSRALVPQQIRDQVVQLSIDSQADGWGMPSLQPVARLTLVAADGEEVKSRLAGEGKLDVPEPLDVPEQRVKASSRAMSMIEAERRLASRRVGWLVGSVVAMGLGVLLLAIPISFTVLDVSQSPPSPQPTPQRPLTTPTPPPSWHSVPKPPTPAPPSTPALPTKGKTP